jgi:hypothetical protein
LLGAIPALASVLVMIASGFSESFWLEFDWNAASSCWSVSVELLLELELELELDELVELLLELVELLELESESEDDTWWPPW